VTERWYKEAVVYCVQVSHYADSNGEGCGDLARPDQPAGLSLATGV